MANIGELIKLSQYQAGDFGREGLNGKGVNYSDIVSSIKTPQQKQAEQLNLQALALKVQQMQQQAEIAKRQKELWDSVGKKTNNNKTSAGVTEEIVDNPDAASERDGYEVKLSPRGNMVLSKQNPVKYDRVKVVDRARKMIDADLAEKGIDKRYMKASDYSARLKTAIPEAEKYLSMDGLSPSKADSPRMEVDGRPVNPTGLTSSPEDFMPQYQEKRGMIDVAKDFYFGGNKQPASPQAMQQPAQQYQEGQTATNPKTGKRIVYKGGKWVAIN